MLTSLLYEQSVLDPNFIDLPVPSKEFVIYLNWKIYKSDDDKFAKSILDSLEKKIQDKFDFLSTHSSYIKEMLDDVVPLVKDDARLACISYLKKNKKDYLRRLNFEHSNIRCRNIIFK